MSAWTIIFIAIALILVVISFLVVRLIISFRKASRHALQKKIERVQLLNDRLEKAQPVIQSDIYDYVKNPLTREATFQLLHSRSLTALFPSEFYTIEMAAESNLANWLEFPTELGVCPDEIEYIKKAAIDVDGQNNFVYYHVYKFRVNEPHWAASAGWMLGVVGPYFEHSKPYDHPNSTFSRLRNKLFDIGFPDEEARWVHENIAMPYGFRLPVDSTVLR